MDSLLGGHISFSLFMPVSFEIVHTGVCVAILGDAKWIGGLTKVTMYPVCANLHQKIAILATLIQGLMDTGWQVTQLLESN